MGTPARPKLAHQVPTGLVSPGLYLWEQVWLTRIEAGRRERALRPLREFMQPTAAAGTKKRTLRWKTRTCRPMVISVADRNRRRVTRRSTRARTAAADRTAE